MGGGLVAASRRRRVASRKGQGKECGCRGDPPLLILNHMVQYSDDRLDASLAALADCTRRGVLEKLVRAECSISDLADTFDMTLTGMKKHIGVLERAGLVSTKKVGRVRYCRIGARRLDEVTSWIGRYQKLWDARFSELDKVLEDLKRKESNEHK